jgi:hypothetical protein
MSLGRSWFFILVVFLAFIFIAYNFDRYYLLKQYPVQAFTTCDPAQHSCFTADPSTADPTFQSGAYEKVRINAKIAPSCLDEHTCSNFTCNGLNGACTITYCSKHTLESGESCTNITP